MSYDAMDGEIGVTLVGTGAVADTHAEAIRHTPGLRLVSVASRTRDSAERFVERHRASDTSLTWEATTLDDALADPRVGLVAVTTPTGTHVEIASKVLCSGRHVLVEKPVDVDLGRSLGLARLASVAETDGLVAAAVSQHRYDPASRELHAAINAGQLGKLTSGVASVPWWRSQAYYDRAEWRGTWGQDGGGALMNQGVHTLDLLLWFFGPVARLTAATRTLAHDRIEVEDTLGAVLEFSSGAVATFHATTAAFPGLASRLQVMGSRGSATLEHDKLTYLHVADGTDIGDMGLHGSGNQIDDTITTDNRDATSDASGHARQYADVAEAIRERRRPEMTIGDAASTLTVVHAIYHSATFGVPVDMDGINHAADNGPYRVGTTPSRDHPRSHSKESTS